MDQDHLKTVYACNSERLSASRCILSGFSPHWSGVVGYNHHSAIFTTTQACFITTQGVKCAEMLCLMQFDSTLAELSLSTSQIILGRTLYYVY